MEYNTVICGGTFDHLHKGHRAFLHFAFAKGWTVIIGITTDGYIKMYKSGKNIQRFAVRKKVLENFLEQEHVLERAKIVAINSKFDQTQIPDSGSVALVVSPETFPAGVEINAKRQENGLPSLPLLCSPLVMADAGRRVSSSAVREGSMDREGKMLPNADFLSKTRIAPESVRQILHKPFGKIIADTISQQLLTDEKKIVTVGDKTTKRFHDLGIHPILSVVDFHIERQKVYETLPQLGFSGKEIVLSVKNNAGELQSGVWDTLRRAVEHILQKDTCVVTVDGEEDLLTLPLVLILPIGFRLFYGQPKEGMVVLPITRELKQRVFLLVKQFVPKELLQVLDK